LKQESKAIISKCLLDEAESLRGSAMTYSLIEIVKDRFDQLMEYQVISTTDAADDKADNDSAESDDDRKQTGGKSEKLTKAQKRKQWDRGQGTEKPRGWNWVDIVKHLSQSGHQWFL